MPSPSLPRLNEAATPSWSGVLALGPMVGVFAGDGGDSSEHCPLAHHVLIGACKVVLGGRAVHGRLRALPGGLPRKLYANERRLLLVHLDARRFRFAEAQALAERWRGVMPTHANEGLIDSLMADATRMASAGVDERALVAVEAMAMGSTLADASRLVGLSESRLTHLVTAELGAPPRAWRRWLRLQRGLDLLGEGRNVTEAGHEAGFADAAHFSRSSSQLLGMPPSALRGVAFRKREAACHGPSRAGASAW